MNSPVTIDKPVPPTELVVVQDFLNSRDIPSGRGALATSYGAQRWLAHHRPASPQTEIDDAEIPGMDRPIGELLVRVINYMTATGRSYRRRRSGAAYQAVAS